jgi:DNA-binding NtrC family response regulator
MPADHRSSDPTETVLVANDEVLIRLAISEYLRDCGYRVIEAANADEVISVLRQVQIKVDIVFTDIKMPGSMDGFGLSQWIRANRPGLDVVLAGTVPRAVDAARDLCDEGSAPNPYDPQAVLARIRRLLASRAPRKSIPEAARPNQAHGASARRASGD